MGLEKILEQRHHENASPTKQQEKQQQCNQVQSASKEMVMSEAELIDSGPALSHFVRSESFKRVPNYSYVNFLSKDLSGKSQPILKVILDSRAKPYWPFKKQLKLTWWDYL